MLVEPYETQRKDSRIALPDNVKERTLMVETRATVVEVGPAAWSDEPVPRARPGDKVLIAKFSGHMATGTSDGKVYRLVNDRDIFCAIEVE